MPHSSRIRLFYIFVILFALIFASKLFFLQIVRGEYYSEKASEQYISPIAHIFDRGSIFFAGGIFSGATLKSGYTVAINPSILKNAGEALPRLKSIVPDIDSDLFFLQSGKILDPYEEIAWKISESDAKKIQQLGITGVSIHKERWRSYPGGSLAAHILGFVGYEGDELTGRYGLERYYEDVLERTEGDQVNLFAQAFANIRNSLFYDSRYSGAGDLVLTIDPEVQGFLEGTLSLIVKTWNAKSGGAIVINPKTGALYALAANPTFDPNNFREVKDFSVFSNPLVESVFEMGSTIKPLTLAAGFDAGVITPTDTYYDDGFVEIGSARIENFDGKARGRVSMQEVLNQSLNTGAVHIAKKLGNKLFSQYFLSYGFGERTGIDLPNEALSLVKNLRNNRDVEIATASFGQGFAITPVAMVRALSVLANGGTLVTPHIVDEIDFEEGFHAKVRRPNEGFKRVISQEASEEITRMLVRVVDEALLGGVVKMPHYSIAAKTGTAQIASPRGGYYDDRFLHSFFGYFPAYDPRFLIFFYIVEPKGVRYASETLTHPFIDTVNFLTHYYNVPPDR
ncbi:MAG: penicillin-binding protein 2 [Parcubacteria group bacterium]|nr:penicillin-binding protein 2 [Parcubacteria group bacterium]